MRARDASRAFGARAPAGRSAGSSSQSQCTYAAGSHNLGIVVTPASADMQRAFGRPPFAQHEHRVTVPGAIAVARTLIRPGAALGAQTTLTLLKSGTSVQLVLTDQAKRRGSLTPALVRLARAAARRL